MGDIMTCKNCDHPLTSTHRFCTNCGSAITEQLSIAPSPIEPSILESETVMESHVEESIIEIRLKKPVMIGNYQLSLVFGGLVGIFIAPITVIVCIYKIFSGDFHGPLFLVLIMSIVLFINGISSFFTSTNSRRKKRCPHCRKENDYYVSHDVHECPHCLRKIMIIWV